MEMNNCPFSELFGGVIGEIKDIARYVNPLRRLKDRN